MRCVERIIGEQYVPMISSFHYSEREPVSGNSDTLGWTCCNDVHEIFSAMEEVTLTSAYMLERENGEIITWNCRATRDTGGSITILLNDDIISSVNINLKKKQLIP